MIFQLLFLSIFSLGQSHADGVLIRNADSMFSDTEKKTVRLNGHVQVMFQGQSLSADNAVINGTDQTLEASGHVILESLKIHIEGSSLRFNYKTNTGIIYSGFVQSGQVIFEGDVIEKTGPDTFVAQNAEYTACETCPPGWAFSGRTIEAEMGGYAYVHRAVFKVGGIPIFVFPAMLVPLKTTRQSGFLTPTMGSSSLGKLNFGESYFWAIDRSRDLTITAIDYQKEGFKAMEDYRYILSPDSKGRLESAFLDQDRALAAEYLIPTVQDRWFVDYSHYFDLPDDFVQRMDIKQASDVRYVRDFPLELPGLGDPSLENKLSVTKNTEDMHFSAEAVMNENLLKYQPFSDNTDAVHKMPEIEFNGRERRLWDGGPLFRWDATYDDFVRDQYSYDSLTYDTNCLNGYAPNTPQGAGCQIRNYLTGQVIPNQGGILHAPFNPATDLIRTGQRLDISPTVSYPFQIGHYFDVLPSATYRETQYRFDLPDGAEQDGYDTTAARRYIQTDITARTEFSTVYGDDSDDHQSTRWKHSIVPELSYDTIPWMRNPNDPFFGNYSGLPYYAEMYPISDADLIGKNKLQFDYDDRVYAREVTTGTLTNSWTRKYWKDGDPYYERAVMFSLSQSYDFEQTTNGSTMQPWSPISTLLQAKFKNFETMTTASYNFYAHIPDINTAIKAMLDQKNFLKLSYNINYLVDQNNNVTPGSETETYGVGGGFTSKYLEVGGDVYVSPLIGWRIQSYDSYGIIKPPGNCWHLKVVGTQVLGGSFSYSFNFAFDFSGEKPAPPGTTNNSNGGSNSTNGTQI